MSTLRFVVGRLTKHFLRADTVDGFLGDDAGGDQQRGSFALRKQAGGRLGLSAPGADVLSISTEGAQAIAAAGVGATLLLGWPEEILVVRRGGTVAYGEGDILHFGELALDGLRTIRRSGFDYLADHGAEVRPHIELEERSAIGVDKALRRGGFAGGVNQITNAAGADSPAPPVSDLSRLSPGQRTKFGPYELLCERAYDYERRAIAGQSGHAYFFRLTRSGEDPVAARDPSLPDPFTVTTGAVLVSAARSSGLLDGDEIITGEAGLADWLGLYEGPRGALEKELRAAGPSSPQLRWRGDTLEAHAARLVRLEGGSPAVGKVVVSLAPAGIPRVTRAETTTLPGRLRRPTTRPPI